jgi:hypothetical protein
MNHPTQCVRITILRFVLVGLVLLFSGAALFADGIASRYPGDVGIENDPEVILADGFETYTDPSQLPTIGSVGPCRAACASKNRHRIWRLFCRQKSS